jgi:hypothetical protein
MQVSPSKRQEVDQAVASTVSGAATSIYHYGASVIENPGRLKADVAAVYEAGRSAVGSVIDAHQKAIEQGHGPEAFGMTTGRVATYLVPLGGGPAGGAITGAAREAGAFARAGARFEGAGPWVAEASTKPIKDATVVAQTLPGSCVSACGEMLSKGAMSEAQFLAKLGEWSNPAALAQELNKLHGPGTWEGAILDESSAVAMSRQGQTFGARLQVPRAPGHMVVIEPLKDGKFLVRDPAIAGTYKVDPGWIRKFVSGGVWRL